MSTKKGNGKNYIEYNRIARQISVLFESIERLDFLEQKEIDAIEKKLIQIKSKI